jgi:hypothetical protein
MFVIITRTLKWIHWDNESDLDLGVLFAGAD